MFIFFIQSTKIEISKIEMFCVTLNFKIFFSLKLHVTLAEGLLTYKVIIGLYTKSLTQSTMLKIVFGIQFGILA